MHNSQGLSSRLLGHGGHYGHSGSSLQPMFCRACFEFCDMGHFVRDFHRARLGGLHQGSQASTFKAAQPLSRGGVLSSICGSHAGRVVLLLAEMVVERFTIEGWSF